MLIRNIAAVLFCAIAVARAQPSPTTPAAQPSLPQPSEPSIPVLQKPAAAQPPSPQRPPPPRPTATPSVVFVAHDPDAITQFRVNGRVVRGMVDRLVTAATGQPDIAHAWASLVSPNDKVGIKISAAGGELFTTHHQVVNAIVDGLVAAGQSRNKIIVWDRSLEGVKQAGYDPRSDGYQLRNIPFREGYDAKAIFTAPVLGKLIWGDLEYRADPGKTVPLSD